MGKSVELAKARRRRAAQKQADKERAVWLKVRKPLLIVICAALLIWGGVSLFNALYVPKNGVAVRNGSITGVGDDWIVTNLGTTSSPSCYHLANIATPEGYTLDPDYSVSDSTLAQARYYTADAEEAAIRSIYVTGVANKSAQDMMDTLTAYSYFTVATEPKTVILDGRTVRYFIATTPTYDTDGNTVEGVLSGTMYAYTDCAHSSSVGVCLISQNFNEGQTPDESIFTEMLEKVMAGLTLVE